VCWRLHVLVGGCGMFVWGVLCYGWESVGVYVLCCVCVCGVCVLCVPMAATALSRFLEADFSGMLCFHGAYQMSLHGEIPLCMQRRPWSTQELHPGISFPPFLPHSQLI
jgi:hypothetical protein